MRKDWRRLNFYEDNIMEIPQDFKELLELFNNHNVEYLIVGGYALAFHGAPRFTGDIDLFVRPDKENAENILDALNKFGFSSLNLSIEDFSKVNQVVQLGVQPIRIDILTSLTNVSWDVAFSAKVKGKYGDVPVYFIGKKELIENKKALRRNQDMADLEALGE